MNTSNAEMYARRARDADNFEEVGENVKKAGDELVRVIKDQHQRIQRLESMARSMR